jgi:hypothetical protein
MSAVVLGKRLKAVAKLFQFCVIDAPPQREIAGEIPVLASILESEQF